MAKDKEKEQQVPCPFFGMLGITAGFYSQGGNACGFEFSGKYVTCQMKNPDWGLCTEHNCQKNQQAMENMMGNFFVYPGKKPFSKHFKQVMDREYR